jgi:hypothetical protein
LQAPQEKELGFQFDSTTTRANMGFVKALITFLLAASTMASVAGEIHVWEKVELTFHAANHYADPYTNVTMWVDLHGPGFNKRCHGFWDGGDVFRVRVLANQPGRWSWRSGSNQKDVGLNGKRGNFTTVGWTEAEKEVLPTRRGFVQPTANGHAFQWADSTPFVLLADTWYAAATSRFKWNDDDKERPIGPDAGFKDYVRLRKSQGFNSVAIIAAFPNWAGEGKPWEIWLDTNADLGVRSTWVNQGDIANGVRATNGAPKTCRMKAVALFCFPARFPASSRPIRTWIALIPSISNSWTARLIT